MKTTFILSDGVVQKLKQKAAEEERSLSSIVEEAVQRYLVSDRKPAKKLAPLPTYDGGGFRVDVSNRDALYDLLDQEE